MSQPDQAPGGCRVVALVLAASLLAGACCVGPLVLGFFFAVQEATPGPQAKAPPAPVVEDREPEPPLVEPLRPPGPEPPIRVTFDEHGMFAQEAALDPDDTDPQAAFRCCRRFVVNARADTAYLVELDGPSELSLRVEATSGGPPIEPQGAFGKHRRVAFVAERTEAYVVFALGALADFNCRFTVRIRACSEQQPLPEALKIPSPTLLPRLTVAHPFKDRLLVGGVFDPDGKSFWISTHTMRLERWRADGARLGSYSIKRRLYALAVDRRGRLYGQPGPPATSRPGVAPRTAGDIDVYERLDPHGDADELPPPVRSILVRGLVPQLLTSPNRRWVYFLDVLNSKIGRIDSDAGVVDRVVDELSPGTLAFCLRPDGRKFYTCAASGKIDVIDVESFAIERTVTLARGKPYELAATDRGVVFLLGQDFGGKAPSTCAVADLSRDGVDKVHAVPLLCDHYGQFLQLMREQDAVLVAGDQRITVCAVPRHPAWEQVARRELRVGPVATPGWIQLGPDGRTVLHDAGAVISLER